MGVAQTSHLSSNQNVFADAMIYENKISLAYMALNKIARSQ